MTRKTKEKAVDFSKIKPKFNEYHSKSLTKFGVLLDDLTMSQKTWLFIEQANKKLAESVNLDCVAFIKNLSPICIRPNFGVMFLHEMWNFDGVLVATDIPSAEQLTKIVSRAKKIFYVWDLEWIRPVHQGGQKDFVRNVDVFRNNELKLVARNRDHSKEISKYCNRNVDSINSNFDIDKLMNLYK